MEKMDSLEEAVKAAKQKKTNSLGACWAYLVYNSKFNENFGSDVLVIFNGKKVLIVNHKVTDFDNLEEKTFVVLKNFSVGFQDELIVSEESKIEVDKLTHVDTLKEFYMLDHIKTDSNCVIGYVASTEFMYLNPSTNKKYLNGKYTIFKVEDRISIEMKVYRVWADNIRYVLLLPKQDLIFYF